MHSTAKDTEKKRVTIKDIAEKLNLNDSTVSRILNNKDFSTRLSTRQLVLKTAKEMGYHRNLMARALVTGKTNLIAFWSPLLTASYYQTVAEHLHRLIRRDGYEMISYEFGEHIPLASTETGYYRLDVDGIVVIGGGLWLDSFLDAHETIDIPMVDIASRPQELNGQAMVDSVSVDTYTPTRKAIEHLASMGCKSIAFLASANIYSNGQRGIAYKEVIQETGLAPIFILSQSSSRPSARDAIKEYIDVNGSPDAVFCHNDNQAIGVYRGLRDLGLSIPGDVALVGCDGIMDTEYLDVPLSTIIQPAQESAETAWRLLTARMKDKDAPIQRVELNAHFEPRESSCR